MDIEAVKVWLQGINMVGTFALGCWLYLEKRSDKTNQRVTDLDQSVEEISKKMISLKAACDGCQVEALGGRIEQLDRDVSALKAVSESAPDHDDISRVYESINDLAETVNRLVGEFEAQGQTLRQILNRIIEKGMP
jgi:archaellum component FlaC